MATGLDLPGQSHSSVLCSDDSGSRDNSITFFELLGMVEGVCIKWTMGRGDCVLGSVMKMLVWSMGKQNLLKADQMQVKRRATASQIQLNSE